MLNFNFEIMSEIQTLTAGMIELNRLEKEMFNSNKWALESNRDLAEYYSKEFKLDETKYLDILRSDENWHKKDSAYSENENSFLSDLFFLKKHDFECYTFFSYCIHTYTDEDYSKLRGVCMTHLIINQFDVNWSLVQKEDIIKKLNLSLDKKVSPFIDDLFNIYGIDINNVYEPFSHHFDFSYKSGSKLSFDSIVFHLWENVMKGLKEYKKEYIFKLQGEELNITDRKFSAIYLDKYSPFEKPQDDYGSLIESALNLLDENGYLFIKIGAFYDEVYVDLFKYLVENKLLKEVYVHGTMLLVASPRRDGDSFVIETGSLFNDIHDSAFKIRIELKAEDFKDYSYSLMKLFNSIQTGERNLYWGDFMKEYPRIIDFDETRGRVFTTSDQSKDYDSAVCESKNLKIQPIDSSYIKITENVIVVDYSNHFNVTYLKATNDVPAFISKSSYFGIWRMNEEVVYPLYFYYLSKNGELDEKTRNRIYYCDGPDLEKGEEPYYAFLYEPHGMSDDVFFQIRGTVEEQKKSYDSIYSVWKQMKENREQKARFEQKEWLNEKHIRNIKHRLNDELTPLFIGLDSLKNFMEKSGGCINSNDVIGERSGRTVAMQLDSLINQISKIESSIKELTDSNLNSHFEILDVNNVVREYLSKALWKFPVEFVMLSPEARILGNSKLLSELIDLIIENANRHGFIGREFSQNKVIIRVENTIDRKCKISISNNGKPMSERAGNIYFERGSYAGETGHSGIGGARIRDIVERMQGIVSLQLDETNEFPVCIEMLFPNIY